MATILPTALFPNYQLLAASASAPSEGIFIPLSDLTGLVSAEANATTGDGRKVAYELVRKIVGSYQGLATDARPGRMGVAASTPTGITAEIVRRSYTLSFDVGIGATDLADEP